MIITEEERAALRAGTMDDLSRRRLLNRVNAHYTPERIAEALLAKAKAEGVSVVELVRLMTDVGGKR